jgi:hypothetical protein
MVSWLGGSMKMLLPAFATLRLPKRPDVASRWISLRAEGLSENDVKFETTRRDLPVWRSGTNLARSRFVDLFKLSIFGNNCVPLSPPRSWTNVRE